MKKISKILAIFLSVVIFISIVPITASAATYTGKCGTNLTWSYNTSTYTLTISGTGAMYDYVNGLGGDCTPWYNYASNIKKVVINNGVTEIGTGAFDGCTSLTSVTIPESVTTIGGCAFYGCTSLTSVTIPDSVTTIGDCAFDGCTSLTSVTIGNGVKTISVYAFYNCGYYNTASNWENGVLYIDKYLIEAKDSLYGSYTIKNGTKVISDGAFGGCSSLTSVAIPDSVTTIGGAFSGCESLAKITVDSNNKYYSSDTYGVLFNKNKTTLVQYPTGNTRTSYTIPNSVTTISGGAFSSCASLTSVTIGDGVTTIGDNAFSGCDSLKSVAIPNSVKTIGNYAFCECYNLTSVTIGDGVTAIGGYVFDNCGYYNKSTNWQNGVLYIGKYLIGAKYTLSGSYIIKTGTKVISDCAFAWLDSLTSITIPDSVTSIGDSAFYGGESLTKITVNSNNKYYSSDSYGVLFNKNKTELIQYPKGNTRTSYTIPNSVTTIGDSAFCWCDNLTGITIPNSVTTIGDSAFSFCYGLTSVIIPESVTSIGGWTFSSCSSLTSVTIPRSVTSIAEYAFYDSGYDMEVYYGGTRTQWSNISIESGNGCLDYATIHYHTHNYKPVATPATCEQNGYTTYTCECGDTYVDEYVDALGHADNNNDGKCDNCHKLLGSAQECDCNCHKTGISKFFFDLILFFQMLFGSNEVCDCGVAHY